MDWSVCIIRRTLVLSEEGVCDTTGMVIMPSDISFFLLAPKLTEKQMERKVKGSPPQRFLFEQLKLRLKDHKIEYNFAVRTLTIKKDYCFWNVRYIDVADLTAKTAYEYDGKRWHQGKRKAKDRDAELGFMGWKVVHVNINNLLEVLDPNKPKLI